jgi:hypothetical protein
MPQTISAKQCRQARSLLKWNVPDLANKSGVVADRIDKFERNLVRLHQPEFKELIRTLEDSGIEFKADFEVKLKKAGKSGSGAGNKTYHVDNAMNSSVADEDGQIREERSDSDEN